MDPESSIVFLDYSEVDSRNSSLIYLSFSQAESSLVHVDYSLDCDEEGVNCFTNDKAVSLKDRGGAESPVVFLDYQSSDEEDSHIPLTSTPFASTPVKTQLDESHRRRLSFLSNMHSTIEGVVII